jgi:hypothetical protein
MTTDPTEQLVKEFESIQGYKGADHRRMARAAIAALQGSATLPGAAAAPTAPARDDDAEWLHHIGTGTHPDVTLHSGTASIRLNRIADRLASSNQAEGE